MTDEVKQQIRQYLLLAAVTFLAGGGGASVMGRPDPFTGTMGIELEARLQKQIDRVTARNDKHDTDMVYIREELSAIRAQLVYLNSGFKPLNSEHSHD